MTREIEADLIRQILESRDAEEREALWADLLLHPPLAGMIRNLCIWASQRHIEDAESQIYEWMVFKLAQDEVPETFTQCKKEIQNLLTRSRAHGLINIPESQYLRFIRVMKNLEPDESNLDYLLKKIEISGAEFNRIRAASDNLEYLAKSASHLPSIEEEEAMEIRQILDLCGEILDEDQALVLSEKYWGSPYRNRSDAEVAETLNDEMVESTWTRRIVQLRRQAAIGTIRQELGLQGVAA